MSSTGSADGYPGRVELSAGTSEFNAEEFHIQQLLNLMNIATLVVVKKVTGGGIAPIGTVDVQPLVNMIDGLGNATQHATVFSLPYFRIVGGKNAVIIDPEVGDIGLAVFADRDISSVKTNQAAANPGSFRRNSMSDGLYIGAFLTKDPPTQYVQFDSSNGITITDKNSNSIVMNSSGITINGVLFDRTQHVSQAVEYTANGGHTLTQHTHTQPNDSHGDTEQPTHTPTG